MIDHQSVNDWLNRYVAAWKSYDPAEIGALFSEDARYNASPFHDPYAGRDAIVAAWLENPDDPDTYDAKYRAELVEGDQAVATGRSLYYEPGSRRVWAEFNNVFILRFNDAGECTEFREWFMKAPYSKQPLA